MLKKRIKYDIRYIVICLMVYVVNEKTKTEHSVYIIKLFFSCYLNDLMCGVLFSAYTNLVYGIFMKNLILKQEKVIILTFVCGIGWEFVAPLFVSGSVTDILDILCYVLGSIMYVFYFRRKEKYE